jgi:hypothetical protein
MLGTAIKCPAKRKWYMYSIGGKRAYMGISECGCTSCRMVTAKTKLPDGYDPLAVRWKCMLCGHYFWAFPATTYKEHK